MAEDEWVYVSKKEWEEQSGCYALLCLIVPEFHRLRLNNALLVKLLQRTWDAWHGSSVSEFDALKNDLRNAGVEVDHAGELGIEVDG